MLDLSNTCDAKRASSRGLLLWNGCGASRVVRSLIKAQEPLRQEFSGLYTRGLRSRVSVQKRAYDFEPLLTIRACVSAAGEQFQFGGDSVGEEEGSAISDQYPTVRSASAIISDQPIYFPEEKRAVGEVEVVAGGAGGNGKAGGHDGGSNGGGGGHGDSGRDDGESNEEEAFGVLLDSEQVAKELQARGISLPPDMAEAARTVGIRELLLSRYIELQVCILQHMNFSVVTDWVSNPNPRNVVLFNVYSDLSVQVFIEACFHKFKLHKPFAPWFEFCRRLCGL